jgi:hypothetical protein
MANLCRQQQKTHLGLHAKCPRILPDFNQIWEFLDIFMNASVSNYAEISPVGTTQMRPHRYDEANKPVLRLCEHVR